MRSPLMSSRSLTTRGIVALILGAVALFLPGPFLVGLMVLMGGYALAMGIVALVAAMKDEVEGRAWLFLEAAAGIAAGIAIFLWPSITILSLTYVIGAWAIVTGVLQIAESFTLRQYIQKERLYFLGGVVSVLLGFLILSRPVVSAITITTLLGVYGIVFGILSLLAGRRVRDLERTLAHWEERKAA